MVVHAPINKKKGPQEEPENPVAPKYRTVMMPNKARPKTDIFFI
jgi:hypothetical protein